MTPFAAAEENPLKSFRWDYRLILISAPATEAKERVAELKAAQAGIDERHVLWFVFDGQSVITNYRQPLGEGFRAAVLERYFKEVDPVSTALRLVGKDGGIKERAGQLDLAQLFARIDSMPMRQSEIKGK